MEKVVVVVACQEFAEVESLGLAREYGCRDTVTLVSQLLRISPGEARDRVRAAVDLGPRRGLTGESLPPLFEQVAAAQVAGSISGQHAQIVTRAIDALPAALQSEHEQAVQDTMVQQAQTLDPQLLAQDAQRITDTLDPDGTLATEHDRHRRRELTIKPRRHAATARRTSRAS